MLRWLALVVLIVIVGVAAVLADALWNGSSLFYAALGRDRLVSLCMPPVRDTLVQRGFTPTDLALGERPGISFTAGAGGAARTLADAFTFSDGPDGPRVDGHLVCVVSGKTVTVNVHVDELPLRAA